MKKVFYKKVLPIALAASMTVTALSGAISASAVQAVSDVVAVSSVPVVSTLNSGSITKYETPENVVFDYFDADSAEETLTLEFLSKDDYSDLLENLFIADKDTPSTSVAGITLTAINKGEMQSHEEDDTEHEGEKITVEDGYKYTLTAKVKATVASISNLCLSHKDGIGALSTAKFTLTVERTGKTGFTTYADNTLKAYAKSLPIVDLGKLPDITTVGDGTKKVFTKAGDVQSVKIPATVRTIETNAFSGCSKISYIEVDSGESAGSDMTIKVKDTTFANTLKTIPVIVTGANKVTFTDSQDKEITFSEETPLDNTDGNYTSAGKNLVCQLNDVIKFNEKYIQVGTQKVKITESDANTNAEDYKTRKSAGSLNYAKYSEVTDWSTVKWGIYKKDSTGTSPVGKFLVNGKYNGATVTGKKAGDTIFLKAVKSDGAFNGVAEVRGTVSKECSVDHKYYDCIVASFEVCVEPQWVSGYKNLAATDDAYTKSFEKDSEKKFTLTPLDTETSAGAITEYKFKPVNHYKLEIYEGQSFKLPFTAKDGANKTLAYDLITDSDTSGGGAAVDVYSQGFTVIGGTVKGLFAGAGSAKNGTIKIYPVDKGHDCDPNLQITVDVYVKPAVKALRLNTTSLTLLPKAGDNLQWQKFTVSANPVTNGTIPVEISGIPANVKIQPADGAELTVTIAIQ